MQQLCPTLAGEDTPMCAWAGRLSLGLDAHGGHFSQAWEVVAEEAVALPGGREQWPLDLKVDGKAAVATSDGEGPPRVRLSPGAHSVSGAFVWKRLPESLPVPPTTALIALTLRGRQVDIPARSEDGAVFLQKEEGEATAREEDRLDISVHRRLTDDVPALLTTRLVLDVAGKAREMVLGRTLPDGFVAQSIEAPLPVRLEADGRLRAQLRPGQWTITLVARSTAAPARVVRPDPGGPWKAGEEVWVFEARPALRVVTVEGVPGIDPQQTTLPDAWKALPAYVMAVGAAMSLIEHRRGDANPAADQLSLHRQLWLDFDGGGLTARDQIGGTFRRAWRLGMDPESKLGRVTIGGQDQFITRFEPGGGAAEGGGAFREPRGEGVEIRQTLAKIVAESRIPHGPRDIPAVGWQHDFQSVSASLALPPGWRLVHASGADSVSASWIKGWTLLDLFLVLIVGLGVGKVFGARTGALALATLLLIFPEAGAPKWAWLAVLIAEALARALPEGWIRRLAGLARLGAWVGLALVTIPFAIAHVRGGLHPALASESESGSFGAMELLAAEAPPPPAPEAAPVFGVASGEGSGEPPREEAAKGARVPAPKEGYLGSRSSAKDTQNLYRYDPNVMVQTGPGLPSWSGATVAFSWNGPVERSQRLWLWLVPPWLNLVLAFLRVGLVVLLILRLLGGMRGVVERWQVAGAGGAAILLLTVWLAPSTARAAEPAGPMPTPEMLEQLRARLAEKPKCEPNCASFGRLSLDAAPDRLRLRLEAGAAAAATVPLPGNARHWVPAQVLLDGKPAMALTRDDEGTLWLRVPAGSHQLVLDGPLPARDTVQIPFPLRPHAITSTLRGWRVDGLTEEGQVEESLQLTREAPAGAPGAGEDEGGKRSGALAPTSLPPFVTVERSLDLGLRWTARTRVTRQTPTGAAAVLDIPLLPGESVTTPGIHVAKGKVQMNLGADETALEWVSTLAQADNVVLAAAADGPAAAWAETWLVDAGPIWHITLSGIPPVQPPPAGEGRVVTFRPWPGERVTIGVSRPGGTTGQTLTVDGAELTLRPGIRSTDGALSLRLRSSRGGQHFLALPDGATLEALTVDGVTQPLRQDGVRVTVPIHPGAQQMQLKWRERGGLKAFYRASEVDLGVPGVNATVQIDVPDDRWILSVGGPRLGPAVLFWSVLVVLVLVGAFLGRSPLTPLRPRHWILLGIGLSQTSVPAAAVVAGCLFALGWRRARPPARAWSHDLAQLALAVWVVTAAVVLFKGIEQGLLNQPDMRIAGNGSTGEALRWFADRTPGELPQPWIVSVPLLAYRLVMLAWSLWLSLALIRWARWTWACLGTGGLWRPLRRPRPSTPASEPPPAPPPSANAP